MVLSEVNRREDSTVSSLVKRHGYQCAPRVKTVTAADSSSFEPGAAPEAAPVVPSCIILDLDGTLIDSLSATVTPPAGLEHSTEPDRAGELCYKRPHVDEFLDWCFAHVDHVAVWTAASGAWAKLVLQTLGVSADKFAFVWSGKKATRTPVKQSRAGAAAARCEGGGREQFKTTKNLQKVFDSPKYGRGGLGCCRERTLIIDNSPEVYSDDIANGIPVPTFVASSPAASQDTALMDMIPFLEKWLSVGRCSNVSSSNNTEAIDVAQWNNKELWVEQSHHSQQPLPVGHKTENPSIENCCSSGIISF